MANEKSSAAMVPVLIAVIGLLGSLGGAWIATGSKFETELKDNQASVKSLQTDLDEVKKQLTGKIWNSRK